MADPRSEIAGARTWYELTSGDFAARYDGSGGEFWRRFEEELLLEQLPAHSSRILDLGCGPGRLSASLSTRATRVLAVDIALAMTATATSSAPANVMFAVADATRSPLAGSSFDVVVSLGMFEYMSDPTPFLTEIRRLLRPGGALFFTCHNRVPLAVRAWTYLLARAAGKTAPAVAGANRDALFTVVRHQPDMMLALLKTHGFIEADFRGFHFPPAADAFKLAKRLPGLLGRIGTGLAVRMDRLTGRLPLTRSLSPLALYSARKPQ